MRETEHTFPGAGGLEIFYRTWQPEGASEGAPKGTVVLAHGVAEHGGRYRHVAAFLCDRGYEVWAIDHRGHGRSGGTRCYVERFATYCADLETMRLRAALNGTPQFLAGHSMGGAIALSHAMVHPEAWSGLVLSGPAAEIADPPRLQVIIGRIASRIAPRLGVVQLDATGISRDESVVAAYRADPLVFNGKLTARLAAELLDATRTFPEGAARITAPVLIVHGTADALVPISASRHLLEWLGSEDKTLEEYDGLYHELFNEPEQATVLADVADWLDAHLPD